MIIDNLLLSSLCLETKDSTTNIKTTSILRIKTTSLEHTTETKTMNTTTTFATIAPTSTSITMQPGIDSVRHVITIHCHTNKIAKKRVKSYKYNSILIFSCYFNIAISSFKYCVLNDEQQWSMLHL